MDLLTPELGLFFWTLLSFIIVFLVLGKFAWKPILQTLQDREKGIAESIATAEKVKAEMSTLKAENEKLMVKAREESAAMLKEAKEQRDRIVNEAKDIAKTEANKIMVEVNQQIQQQKNAAITQVKNEVGAMALKVAEDILRKELTTVAGQEAYINSLGSQSRLN
jgi:F-type H+-transporting ATPase subunit b